MAESNINTYFEEVYVINLKKRRDRFLKIKNRLLIEQGTWFRLHEARDGTLAGRVSAPLMSLQTNPQYACSMSHVDVLRKIVEHGHKRALILEDDCVFSPNLNQYFDLYHQEDIPKDWDMLYLGGNHTQGVLSGVKNCDWLSRASYVLTTSSYAVTLETAKFFLEKFGEFQHKIVDMVYADYHKELATYIFDPPVAWQEPGYSDIQDAKVDYSDMRPKGKK